MVDFPLVLVPTSAKETDDDPLMIPTPTLVSVSSNSLGNEETEDDTTASVADNSGAGVLFRSGSAREEFSMDFQGG